MNDDKLRALVGLMTWMQQHHVEILSPHPDPIKATKRIGEIAGLARRILEANLGHLDPMLEQHASEWLRLCWNALREGEVLVEAIEWDPNWMSLATTYLPFFHRGLRSERFESKLHVLGPAIPQQNPMGFWVSLTVACSLAEMKIPCSLDILELARRSWVFRIVADQRPDPARAYETTHVMMWLGDLGMIPPDVVERVAVWNRGWMKHFEKVHNGDVLAELLMMQHYFGECGQDTTWRWLLDRQDVDGSFKEMDVPTRVLGRFHATVVAGHALAMCLGPPHKKAS